MHALAIRQPELRIPSLIMSELWQRLRHARRFADLTQQDLANKCGVSRGAVALWEAAEPEHRTKPTTDHLIHVSKATGVPLEWLLNDAADLDAVWRLTGEFGEGGVTPRRRSSDRAPEVLPDLRQEGHVFCFAQTPEQIAAKLAQLATEPEELKKHLILIGVAAAVHIAPSAADALSLVVRELTAKP